MSSTQIVIRCVDGKPFIAASPQKKEPSLSKREMESAVCPKVEIIFPFSKVPISLRLASVTRMHLFSNSFFSGGKRWSPFPINFKITKYDWRIYAKSKKEKVKPQT